MIHANGIHFNTFETEARGGLRGDLDTWIYFFCLLFTGTVEPGYNEVPRYCKICSL